MPICVRCSGFNPLSTGAESRTLSSQRTRSSFHDEVSIPLSTGAELRTMLARLSVLPRLGHVSIPSAPGRSRAPDPNSAPDGPDELLFQSPQHRGGVAHGAGVGQYWPTDFPVSIPSAPGRSGGRGIGRQGRSMDSSVSIPSAPGRSRARQPRYGAGRDRPRGVSIPSAPGRSRRHTARFSAAGLSRIAFQSPQHRGGVAHKKIVVGHRGGDMMFQSPQHRGGVATQAERPELRFLALGFNPLSTGAE